MFFFHLLCHLKRWLCSHIYPINIYKSLFAQQTIKNKKVAHHFSKFLLKKQTNLENNFLSSKRHDFLWLLSSKKYDLVLVQMQEGSFLKPNLGSKFGFFCCPGKSQKPSVAVPVCKTGIKICSSQFWNCFVRINYSSQQFNITLTMKNFKYLWRAEFCFPFYLRRWSFWNLYAGCDSVTPAMHGRLCTTWL